MVPRGCGREAANASSAVQNQWRVHQEKCEEGWTAHPLLVCQEKIAYAPCAWKPLGMHKPISRGSNKATYNMQYEGGFEGWFL